MSLYTFILEYCGGTYIAQSKGRTLAKVCAKWSENLDESQIPGLGKKGKESLARQVLAEPPAQLEETENVWCSAASVHGKLALITIVKTEAAQG